MAADCEAAKQENLHLSQALSRAQADLLHSEEEVASAKRATREAERASQDTHAQIIADARRDLLAERSRRAEREEELEQHAEQLSRELESLKQQFAARPQAQDPEVLADLHRANGIVEDLR